MGVGGTGDGASPTDPLAPVAGRLRRRAFLAQGLAASALAAGALGPAPAAAAPLVPLATSSEEVPAEGGLHREALVGRPHYLNPLLAPLNPPDEDVVALVFAGLTRLTPAGEVIPDLAAGWDVSADGLAYTFRLREDARWHDGRSVGADDVLYTLRTLQDPEFRGPAGLAELWRGVAAEAPGARLVRLTLREPFAPFPELAALGLLPAHLLGGVPVRSLPEHPLNARPVGAGPYRVIEASRSQVVLEASPDHHGQRPYLQRVQLRYFESAAAALAALQPGEALGLRGAPPARLAALGGLAVRSVPLVSRLTLLVLNVARSPLSERAVRRAIAHAVEPRTVGAAALGEGAAVAAVGLLSPASWAFDPAAPRVGHDPARARELLDAAGWRAVPGERYRQREGQRLELVILANDDAERVRAAEAISRQLALVGVKAEVQAAGWTGFVQDFLVPGRFQAAVVGQSATTADPDLYAFWHSSQAAQATGGQPGGLGVGGWSSPVTDDLLARARREPDRRERARLYAAFQATFADDVPAVPLYYPLYTYAVPEALRGYRPPPLLLRPSDRLAEIGEWHVRTRRVPRGR